jgi:ABC-type phosphate transport system auxiliary subunit
MNNRLVVITRTLAIAALIFGSSLNLATAGQAVSGEDDTQKIEIRIENRQALGDKVIRITQDQRVELLWITDEAAELHIHGYDIRFEISPDAPAQVAFTAHATGRYAVTSHGFGGEHGDGHETLIYIEVYPN